MAANGHLGKEGDYINNNASMEQPEQVVSEVSKGAEPGKLQLYIGSGQGGDHGNGNRNYKKPEQV